MNCKVFFIKAKSIAFVFALIAIAMTFNSCKKEIKLKHLEGTWTIKSYTFTSTEVTTTDRTYDDSDCGDDVTDCTDTETYNESFNGTTVTGTYEHEYDGGTDCCPFCTNSDREYSGAITTWTIEIKDDGSYTVSISYTAECEDDDGFQTVSYTYSGNVNTSTKTWFIADADKENSVITFYDFPYIDFTGNEADLCTHIDAEQYYDEITFRLESESKDEMVWKALVQNTTSETVISEYEDNGGPTPINCQQTETTAVNTTGNWTFNLSK